MGRMLEGPAGETPGFGFSNLDFLKLAIPNTLSAISMPLAGLINTMVIGQVGDANVIGGVAISSALLNIIFFAFNFMRSGTLGLTAQAFGANDRPEQKAIAVRSALVALCIGTVLVAAQMPIAYLGLSAFGADGEVHQVAKTYLTVRIWSAPFTLLNYAVVGWVMGRGQAMTALIVQLVGNGLNIAASFVLVIGLRMGIQGAALASVLAEVVTAALGAFLVAWTSLPWRSQAILDVERLARMLRVNADIFVRSLFLFLALALFTRFGADFGPATLAANAILLGIFQTSAAGLDGISAAAEQLVGRAVGANSLSAFRKAVRASLAWGTIVALALAAFMVAGIGPLIAISAKAPDVVQAASEYRSWVPVALLASVLAYQMDGIFVGATWSREMRDIMLMSALTFAVSAYWLSIHFGNHGLWAAFILFLVMRGVLAAFRLSRNLSTAAQRTPGLP